MLPGKPIGSRVSLARYGETIPLRTLHVTVYFGQVDPMTELETTSSHFKKVRGLSNQGCVSFESAKRPGRFLRHRGPDTRVELADGLFDPWFAADATFCPRWASGAPSWASVLEFESVNHTGYFLRKTGDHLRLSRWDSSQPYAIGFVEMRPRSLGVPLNWGGWTVRADGSAYIERWGECTGLTPIFGQPRWRAIHVLLSTGRVVVSAAVSTPSIGFYPLMRLNSVNEYLGDVYSVDRWVLPCVW